jgi:thioester reductase-like protein
MKFWEQGWDFSQARMKFLAGDLASPQLGFSDAQFEQLTSELDWIVHAGCEVNWMKSFREISQTNVEGTLTLLRLATLTRLKPFFYISTAGVSGMNEGEFSPVIESLNAYSQSKYAAEILVRKFHDKSLPTAIFRPSFIFGGTGQGCGIGVVNPRDFLTRFVQAVVRLGYHPSTVLGLDVVPVVSQKKKSKLWMEILIDCDRLGWQRRS